MSTATLQKVRIDLISDNQAYERAMARSMATNKRFATNAKSNVVSTNRSVSSSFRNAATSVAVLDGPLGGVAGRMSSFASLAGSGSLALGVFGVGVAAVTAGLYKGVQAFSDLEQRQLKTQALIKATGSSAGYTADQLDGMARATALNTLASTQQIREAQDVLLTFRSVSGPIFKDTIELSQDLAAVMGTDAKQAALQLAKALEEPTIGLSALRRSGVSFSESEKELIKDLAETNRLSEAQALILEKVRKQVGGAGSAEAGGLAGSVDTLSQRWQEFLESLGKTSGAAETSQWWIDQLAGSMDGLRRMIDPTEGERVLELMRKRREEEQFLQELVFDPSGNRQRGAEARISLIDKELEQIRQVRAKRFEEQRQAQEAAQQAETDRIRENNEQQAKEAEEKRKADLDASHQQSARILTNLETQLANEEGRLKLSYERRKEQIDQLVLSEQQVRQMGYDNLNQLQLAYLAANEQNYDAALQKRRDKDQAEQERLQAAAEAKRQKELEDQQRQQEEADIWLETLQQQNITKLELLAEQKQQELDQAEEYRQKGLFNKDQHRRAEQEIDKKYNKLGADYQRKQTQMELAAKGKVYGELAELGKAFAGEQSALYKGLFAASKTYNIAETLMNSAGAISKAWNSAPFPANLGPVAITAAKTGALTALVQGVELAGMAHDGIDSIPEDGTWLLKRKERVVDSRTNEDLKQYLSSQNKAANQPIQQITFSPQIMVESGAGQDADAQFAEKVAEQAYNKVYEDVTTGGPIRTAMGV
ncbi:phage tail length tape measure family protein [Endozoicomonas lisbonensis]|uniref:Phage-related minor tail protein n=1 Tax=Endozoicomonas lisbonensis TaxID=3120522 RepID=A0ABV2SFJ5_9GAMM